MKKRIPMILAALLFFANACGGTSEDDATSIDPAAGTDPPATDTVGAEDDTGAADVGPADDGADASAADDNSAAATADGSSVPIAIGDGRPTLSWAAVPGAADYQVVVRDGDGAPYWSWIGTDTSVPVGGAELSGSTPGPRVALDYSWTVVAWDSDGTVLALSEEARFVE